MLVPVSAVVVVFAEALRLDVSSDGSGHCRSSGVEEPSSGTQSCPLGHFDAYGSSNGEFLIPGGDIGYCSWHWAKRTTIRESTPGNKTATLLPKSKVSWAPRVPYSLLLAASELDASRKPAHSSFRFHLFCRGLDFSPSFPSFKKRDIDEGCSCMPRGLLTDGVGRWQGCGCSRSRLLTAETRARIFHKPLVPFSCCGWFHNQVASSLSLSASTVLQCNLSKP